MATGALFDNLCVRRSSGETESQSSMRHLGRCGLFVFATLQILWRVLAGARLLWRTCAEWRLRLTRLVLNSVVCACDCLAVVLSWQRPACFAFLCPQIDARDLRMRERRMSASTEGRQEWALGAIRRRHDGRRFFGKWTPEIARNHSGASVLSTANSQRRTQPYLVAALSRCAWLKYSTRPLTV